MIRQIREKLSDYIGENVVIKYNLGRNKYEKYNVVIKELYENIFIVEVNNCIKKSFSYTDVLTKTIKIDY
ncbi:MAG: Veg family protein [Bacilli bacterium]|nr:Veg family protein [Bacilli bacterium]